MALLRRSSCGLSAKLPHSIVSCPLCSPFKGKAQDKSLTVEDSKGRTVLVKSELDYSNKQAALKASAPGSRSNSISKPAEAVAAPRSGAGRSHASSANSRRRHASVENVGKMLATGDLKAPSCARCHIPLQEEELAFNRRLVEIAERKQQDEEGASPSKARENPEDSEGALYCIKCHYEVFVQPRGSEAGSERGSRLSRRSRGSDGFYYSKKQKDGNTLRDNSEEFKQLDIFQPGKKEAAVFWNSFYGHPIKGDGHGLDAATLARIRGDMAAGSLIPKNWKQGLADKLQAKYSTDQTQWDAKIQRSLDKQRVKSRIGTRLAEENKKILQNAAFRNVAVVKNKSEYAPELQPHT